MPLPSKSASFQSKWHCKPVPWRWERRQWKNHLTRIMFFWFFFFWIRNKHCLKDRNFFFFFFLSRSFSELGVNCYKEPSKNIFKMLLLQLLQWYNFFKTILFWVMKLTMCSCLFWPWPCFFLSSLLTLKMNVNRWDASGWSSSLVTQDNPGLWPLL